MRSGPNTDRSPPVAAKFLRTVFLAGFALLTSAAGQTSPVDPDAGETPRTPAGHPDLQGNWTNATLTPLQRPRGWDRVLTPDEVAEIELGQAELVERAQQPSSPDRALPEGGNNPICIDGPTSCYNEAYREPGERVAVVNGEPRSSLVTRPEDGRVPTLTEEARAGIAERRARTSQFSSTDHPELRPLGERCLLSFGSNAGPPMLPNYWYNNNYTIVQTPDHVLIMAEMVHDARIIRLGERTPLPDGMDPWLGDSWGRWEGDTLVVETTDIRPDQTFQGVPLSGDGRIVERFTRVDAETIIYEFTIDDPVNFTAPWGGEIPFVQLDGLLYEYACHEGNYSLENVLSGARYEEGRGG